MADTNDKMEKIVSLCKRRGFIFQSSEIYGGLGSCWDYGPLGVLLKNNLKAAWWHAVVQNRDDMVGLDAAILMHPETWKASGHLETFHDPLVDCLACRRRFRADHVPGTVCPECGGQLTEPRNFNLMFKTFMGPVEDSAAVVYLRPETAQGIFVNFKNVLNSSRKKPPFGIAQIGKSFRNEITPGNFTFRTREFEQMEIEFFSPPDEADQWFEHWVEQRFNWYVNLGMKPERLRKYVQKGDELAHYSKACIDLEYEFPFGFSELEGIANRTDYDLKQHAHFSGKDLSYFDEETKTHYIPYVIEPSAGADRATLAFLVDAYDEETDDKGETRVVLRLHPTLAPYKVAVLPLSKKPELIGPARLIAKALSAKWSVDFDVTASIGKRYRRQDEVGTPFCLTVDFDSLHDQSVTIRERDSMDQVRLPIDQVIPWLEARLNPQPTLSNTVFAQAQPV